MSKSKGFTLIELLVVIAIIGILSSVVLASLNTARTKAKDGKVQAQISNMRAQAELYTGTGNAFSIAACATTANSLFETGNNGLGNLLAGLTLADTLCASAAGTGGSGMAWAVSGKTSAGAFCADSTGYASDKTKASAGATAYTTTLSSAMTGTTCL